MRRSPETLVNAAHGDASTAVLGLCALMFSSIASAGTTSLCDTRTIAPPDLDIQASELTIELIDLGAPASVEIDVSIDVDARALPSPPDVDAMLKQMFNLSDDVARNSARNSSPASSIPLVELSTPATRIEAPIIVSDEPDSDADSEVAPPAVSTRIPGLTDDEMRRYRSKMYRTDI